MTRSAILLLLIWTVILPVHAQITITNSVFPEVGDTLHYTFGNQPGAINQIYTPPGFQQQWDLSNLQPTQSWKQVMREPATGSAFASFTGASMMFHPPNSTSEVYLQVTGDQVIDMGYFGQDIVGLGLDLLFRNTPGMLVTWAPTQFFDVKAGSSSVLIAFDATWAPPVLLNLAPTADSFRIRITMQSISAVDASGTLSIPGGTFDVLRKKETLYRSLAMDVKIAPLGWIDLSTIGGQQFFPLRTDTLTTFHFLNDLSKESIAICSLNTSQNEVTSVQYKAVDGPTSTDHLSQRAFLKVYPNPARETLYVHLESNSVRDGRLRLVDMTGLPVWEQPLTMSGDIYDIVIPADDLVPGAYVLTLEQDGIILARSRVIR